MVGKFIALLLLTNLLIPFNVNQIFKRDDTLTLLKQSFQGNQLKLNGYYYQKSEEKYYTIYFFYENGIILYGGGGFTHQELIKYEKEFYKESWINAAKEFKYFWGIYIIEEFKISFEKWYPSSGGPLPLSIRSGDIINDTTFVITKLKRSDGSYETKRNEIYYFKEFTPKPDSTNKFIE